MSKQYEIVEKRIVEWGGGWHARVKIGDRIFFVGVQRGARVRIAFRGNAFGYRWHSYVRDERGETLHAETVPKSLGVHGILVDAGLIKCEHRTPPPGYRGQIRDRCSCGARRMPDGTWSDA